MYKNLNSLITGSIFIAALTMAGCGSDKKSANAFTDPLASHTDSSLSAATNFFMFANNGWFKANPIPASERSNGIFNTIQDTVNNAIKNICEQSAGLIDPAKGSNEQKIGDFYFSGMDTVSINKAGITPLNEELAMIDGITDLSNLSATLGKLNRVQAGGLFGFYVGVDDMNSSKYAATLLQGGIGLPDRDYYFNTDARTSNIRAEYVKHIAAMLKLMGSDDVTAASDAKKIMAIETDLAKSSRTMADRRDPYRNYNKITASALAKLTPTFNWELFFQETGLNAVDTVVVGQPEFFTNLNTYLKKYSINDWKIYLKWNLINTYASYLSADFDNQNFNFYEATLSGIKEQKPRWKRVVEQTDESLGELIGQVYVKEYLPAGTKEKLLEIGENIRTVYADHIKKLDWMSEETKKKALSKLGKIVMKVGYPDKWKDMSSVAIDRTSYAKNVMNCNVWEFDYMINHYGKPVDRTEWSMQPQTYNAYYNPSNNEIVVPACNIIVPGFEGRMPDDAILYGIIGGSTFGHELTHGFDDQGSLYDENGNLNNWWTTEDSLKFRAKTKLIVEQFNTYTVLDSLHVNGDATQGENIADLGGTVMGYEAFKKTEQGKGNEMIGGYTPDQRFFLAYAYAWMVNRRPESLARQVMSDVHSPSEFRVNGPLSNIPEFYNAFNVKPTDAMYRADSVRVVIW